MNDFELDRIDLKILKHLQDHARASNLELAQVANLSAPQCHRRHKRLEEAGFIDSYRTRLNAGRLGLSVTAFVHVSIERGHFRELYKLNEQLRMLNEVQEIYSVTGDFDYVLKVIAKDLSSLSWFLMNTLTRLPGVAALKSSVCMDEIKCTSAVPLPGDASIG